jgi:hypothetical protein
MRNFLTAGALAITLALGASSAYALPPTSPYAIWVPQSVDQPAGSNDGVPGAVNEGRSAFVARDADSNSSQTMTPEDQTYYSRGR